LRFSFKHFNSWIVYSIILFIPIVFFSFFSFVAFPAADDISRMAALNESGVENFFQAVSASWRLALVNHESVGTFSHLFVATIVPAHFSLILHRMILFAMFWIYVLSVYFFVGRLSKHIFGFDLRMVLAISLSIVFFTINNMGWGFAENFFWWSGVVNYSLVLACILYICGIIVDLYYSNVSLFRKTVYHFALTLLIPFVALSQQSGALLLTCIFFMFCLFHFVASIKQKIFFQKIYLYIYFALSVVLLMQNVSGAVVRAEGGGLYNGMSFTGTIFTSVKRAASDIIRWHHGLTILFFVMISPAIASCISKRSKIEFKHPIIMSGVLFILLASMYAPAFFGMGELRARVSNFIFSASFVILFLWLCYITGYLINRGILSAQKSKVDKGYVVIMACILMVSGNHLQLILNGNIMTGIYHFRSGEISQYLWVMNWRQSILEESTADIIEFTTPRFPSMVAHNSQDIPFTQSPNWHNVAFDRLFNKTSVRTASDLGSRVFRVIATPHINLYSLPYTRYEQMLNDTVWFLRYQMAEIISELPHYNGAITTHNRIMAVLVQSNDNLAIFYHVHPRVLNINDRRERLRISEQYFQLSIDFSTLDDDEYVFYIAITDGTGAILKLIRQGIFINNGYEVNFVR